VLTAGLGLFQAGPAVAQTLSTLQDFTADATTPYTNSDGTEPQAGLVLAGYSLYGTAYAGGAGNGAVFRLSLAPHVNLTPARANAILSWPTNVAGVDYTGFTLLSATNLGTAAVWHPVVPGPVVVAGQNTVTNRMVSAQQFHRLTH
jgi:hypothetical protein